MIDPSPISAASVKTVAFQGIDVKPVDVEVTITAGLPAFTIVGLPDKAVAESRERVRSALGAIGLSLPPKRITVNMAPADLVKEGSHYDLAIALGLMVAMNALPAHVPSGYIVLGELGLDGGLRAVNGILPAAVAACDLERGLICPSESRGEAAWLRGTVEVLAAPNLLQIVSHFRGDSAIEPLGPCPVAEKKTFPDLKDVKGQETAKRALEIAAAGGHNLLMIGPPGSGKSMLAARLAGILPDMDPHESLETNMIASMSGQLRQGQFSHQRPFREPHHNISMAALVGGGPQAKPGEISLAHHGVLFLDELAEFSRPVLEALRQPLETGKVTIARAARHVTYPARFQFIAAMNPCRCGYLDNPALACSKAPSCAASYQTRISGPLLERIDMHVEVAALSPRELSMPANGEPSAQVRQRVSDARDQQSARYSDLFGLTERTNAEASGDILELVCETDKEGKALIESAIQRLHLSGRGYHRLLRVARTIADLAGDDHIRRTHLAEALSFRRVGPALQLASRN